MFQLSELWWQQAIGDSGLTATVGKIDGARFFGVIPNAGPFLNASDCQPSTMLGTLPTYPNPSMAAILQWKRLTS
jgi:carbohydrate-selective porin OprB